MSEGFFVRSRSTTKLIDTAEERINTAEERINTAEELIETAKERIDANEAQHNHKKKYPGIAGHIFAKFSTLGMTAISATTD